MGHVFLSARPIRHFLADLISGLPDLGTVVMASAISAAAHCKDHKSLKVQDHHASP